MGDYTQAFHNEFCKENWLAFRLNAQNQYELLTDKRYFLLENVTPTEQEPNWQREELIKHYEDTHEHFDYAKQRFVKYGGLYGYKRPLKSLEKSDYQTEPWSILDQLCGGACWGNWSSHPEPPSAFTLDESDTENVIIKTQNNNEFTFIACVPSYHYTKDGADSILLFYEPKSRIALFTFDFT